MMNHCRNKSPWAAGRAFSPMFDENVTVIQKNGNKTPLKCCIFLDNTADPLVESMSETMREDIVLSVDKRDIPFLKTLKRGDVVVRNETNMKKYAVQSVTYDCVLDLIVKARETT